MAGCAIFHQSGGSIPEFAHVVRVIVWRFAGVRSWHPPFLSELPQTRVRQSNRYGGVEIQPVNQLHLSGLQRAFALVPIAPPFLIDLLSVLAANRGSVGVHCEKKLSLWTHPAREISPQ